MANSNPQTHPQLQAITQSIIERSQATRSAYLARIAVAKHKGRLEREQLGCTNLAHAFAAMPNNIKIHLKGATAPNVAIISAYNDMLSAHQPYESYPEVLKKAAVDMGATAQFAGGVPAMCDGVTQGEAGMELSLFSRDVIAMSAGIGLSHQMFDAALYLGVCDKIVPGLTIAALTFGHLPAVFVPAGPMTSGMSNSEKSKVRELYAQGKVGREALLESESASYHSAGTCTFYGTANSNQMLMEIMGLHLPNTAFINPNTPLREAVTAEAARAAVRLSQQGVAVGEMIDEKSIVNGIIGLLTTGGSTNHTIHLIAMARAAGIQITWADFDALSKIIPLLTRIYPNGNADVNHFEAAGGMAYVVRELLGAGLLHEDVNTVVGHGLSRYTQEPWLNDGVLAWREGTLTSGDADVLRPADYPFSADGGLRIFTGNLGRAVIKTSAVKVENRIVEAPAIVFHDQLEMLAAFKRGELERDFIAVVRFQGPKANGMPELHKLTPSLSILQDKGYKVALVTDGRMSGASGKVPAAIHLSPEAYSGGMIGKVQNGDLIRLNAETGELTLLVDEAELAKRVGAVPDLLGHQYGMGRELFAGMRHLVTEAEEGAMSFLHPMWPKF